ncbi:Pal1-domain-containing protein [Trichodelitschia bisporula]|uniref:Pal1-domain-containing protein n=1 Tax=Trichodelitschia bisporula TaxID=703511 RepID=A0A6G1I5X0_9PEZI|nr:Pal1-domain-containing protein [Trichodelitschia bisporula]
MSSAGPQPAIDNEAKELFDRLTLKSTPNPQPSPQPRGTTPSSTMPPPARPQQDTLDIFASPERERKPVGPRPGRRASESSIAITEKSEETGRRRERRDQRTRDGKRPDSNATLIGKDPSKDPSKGRQPKRKPRGMDLIDQLDQTGIYGAGLFHHDGPFDAVNPHRNRKKDNRAPMRAFPANSANNMIGGSGPVNKGIDLERFYGLGQEGFSDYSTAGTDGIKRPSAERAISFDPLARVEPVHGEASIGLGTSTFLEGTPASRSALQRRQSESEQGAAGLARKKSLAQRIRGISKREGEPMPPGRIRSPGERYAERYAERRAERTERTDRGENGYTLTDKPGFTSPPGSPPPPPPPPPKAESAGGMPRLRKENEGNPFDRAYDEAYERKTAAIQERQVPAEKSGHPRAPSSPRGVPTRERAGTVGSEEKTGGGFMNRVKSLKGRKPGRGT